MKAGGYRQAACALLHRTRAHGLLPMLGCMVETSVWASASALQHEHPGRRVHDLDGFLIVRDEPFGLVTEHSGQLRLL